MKFKIIIFILKNALIAFAGLTASGCLYANESFALITEQEYQLQQAYVQKYGRTRVFKSKSLYALQNNPLISVDSPSLDSSLYSPIQIEVRFEASDDADIQAESVKIMYGWWQLDITDRIKQHAHITDAGIFAKNVELPVGEHRITIEIMDSKERRSTKELVVEILGH